MIRTGIDIVYIPSLANKLEQPGFRELAFHPSELENEEPSHLAGVLAAKEALFKALNIPVEWLSIEIIYEGSGRPKISFADTFNTNFDDCDLSIAHDGEYAIASVVIQGGE